MEVSVKTTRKIGLITSISILVGSVVGIGIFFKNISVFNANNNYGINVLIAWIIAAIISTCTAICFGEASSADPEGGIGGWTNKLCGKKLGYVVKINFNLFYLGILIACITVFVSEAIFNIFNLSGKVHMGFIMLLTFGIFFILVALNYFATKVSQISQIVLTSLKFVPIILIIVLGFVFLKNGNSLFDENNAGFLFEPSQPGQKIDNSSQLPNLGPVGIFASLPAILFAFDSFTCVGSIGLEAKSKKTVPISIVVGMILVSIFYILITVVQILIGQGSIGETFDLIFYSNPTAQIIFQYIVSVFMFVSILGVCNSMILTAIRSFDKLVNDKLIIGSNNLLSIANNRQLLAGTILFVIVEIIWLALLTVLSSSFNHDAFVDGFSNYATLFFFFIYGLIVLFTLINHITNKVKVNKFNTYFFVPISIISLIGITIVFGYQFFYENIVRVFLDPNYHSSWGVLFGPSNPFKLKLWEVSIVFFIMLLLFMLLPIINYFLMRKKYFQEKNETKIEEAKI